MSKSPTANDQDAGSSRTAHDEQDAESRTLETVVPTLAPQIRVTSFWGAIILPFGYVPVLVTGLSTAFEAGLFLGLLAVHLLALYVGHAHRRR